MILNEDEMCPNCHSQQIGWITGPNMNIEDLRKSVGHEYFKLIQPRVKFVTRYDCYTCKHKWEEKK